MTTVISIIRGHCKISNFSISFDIKSAIFLLLFDTKIIYLMKITVDMGVRMILPNEGHFQKTSIEDGIISDREF